MDRGIRLGKFLGIVVQLDWSWFLIFLLVTGNLGFVLGSLHEDWGSAVIWGTALAASLLFFGSVLAHEYAHSLVARAQGVPVKKITLFLFGGISNIQRDPPSPKAEFLITIVGPLTSIILGVVFAMGAGALIGPMEQMPENAKEFMQPLGPVATLLLWLGQINLLLGVFNMLPGFPLDGGRILRSILWGILGDVRRATRWASAVGQGVAWLMIFTGVAMALGVRVPIFGTGLVGGLWLAFIGWFLHAASVQSYQQVVIRDMLEGVPVGRIMRKDPHEVPPHISVGDLIHDHILQTDDYAFPVVEEGQLQGIVTLQDVRSVSREERDETPVSRIMTKASEMETVGEEDDAAEAFNRLMTRNVGRLPVLGRDGSLAGVLRRQDFMRWMQIQSA